MRLSSPALFRSAVHCSLPYFSATNRSISPNTTPCIVHLLCPGRKVLCIGKLRFAARNGTLLHYSNGNTGEIKRRLLVALHKLRHAGKAPPPAALAKTQYESARKWLPLLE